MPEVLNCECGGMDFFITPSRIMCQKCLKTYTLEEVAEMQRKYKNEPEPEPDPWENYRW